MLPSAQCNSVTVVCHYVPKTAFYVSAKTVTELDTNINGMNIGSLHIAPDSPCVSVL